MLNRELLKFRRRSGEIHPLFVNPADPKRREPAESLVELYDTATRANWTRGELADYLEPLVKGASDPKFVAGLNKLLLDRAEFQAADGGDFRELRRKFFAAEASAFSNSGGDYQRFRDEIPDAFSTDIYGDLPEYERMISLRRLSPEELLNRYNISLAQSLLIYAGKLDITVREDDPAELRRLFKYLKFFRLLAELRRAEAQPDTVTLAISGPFSLFENTRRYGLALAAFFPALARLKQWELAATLKISGNTTETLRVSDADKLVSHYRNFSAYIPEEIRMFHRLFTEKSPGWTPIGETPFIDGGDQRIVFPDFSFRRDTDGRVLHLELFHRWHSGQLTARLELLDRHPELPLVLGIDRSLARDDDAFAAMLAQHPGSNRRIMRFRDFPGVANVVKLLDNFADGDQPRNTTRRRQ